MIPYRGVRWHLVTIFAMYGFAPSKIKKFVIRRISTLPNKYVTDEYAPETKAIDEMRQGLTQYEFEGI